MDWAKEMVHWKEYAKRSREFDFTISKELRKPKRTKTRALHTKWKTGLLCLGEGSVLSKRHVMKKRRRTRSKKTESECCSTPKIMQLFVYYDISGVTSPKVVRVSSQEPVFKVAEEITDKHGICSKKVELFDEKGVKLCHLLSFEDNGVTDQMNIYAKIVQGLLGGGKPQGAEGEEESPLPPDITKWKKDHVRFWLEEELEVEQVHVSRLLDGGLTRRSLMRYVDDKNSFDEEFKEIPRAVRRNILDAWKELLPEDETSSSCERRRSNSPVPQKSPPPQPRKRSCSAQATPPPLASATGSSGETKNSRSSPGRQDSVTKTVNSPEFSLPDLFRSFDTDENCKYTKGCQLQPETGPDDLVTPCHEYKAFQQSESLQITKQINFMKYVAKFACACLNERTNGTIHFGVGDDIEKDERGNKKYRHGEILGISLRQNDNRNFTDWITKVVQKCLKILNSKGKEVQSSDCDLLKCIRRPKLIPVSPANESQLFVVEVDIVPKSIVCGDYHFKARFPTTPSKGGKLQFTEGYNLYRRIGSSSSPANGKAGENNFVETLLAANVKLRSEIEKRQASKYVPAELLLENENRLKSFLLNGHRNIDDVYPILVCSRPDEETDAERDLSFVSKLNCTVVFDFDVDSERKGLAKVCKSKFDQINVKKYIRSYEIENKAFDPNVTTDKFCENLNFKKDVVWIYPNGHSKYDSQGQCEQQDTAMSLQEWTEKRNRKMGDAIYKLSNAGVTPEDRATVMCILLNSDPESMKIMCECIHTLIVRFSLDKILFIIKNERVRDVFFKHLGERYTKEKLEKRMILGMPWSQINNTITYLTGYVPESSCSVRYSHGGLCEVDIEMQRRLENIAIVSIKQCEDGTMQNDEHFRQEEERKFFTGEKASWWNFFFPGQVCRRDIVDEYHKKIYHASYQQRDEYVYLIELKHERGAGGSTVARHLLWELRKNFRCIEVTELVKTDKDATYETAEQIVDIYLYKEDNPSKCLPVFAVLDLQCEEEVITDLKTDLEEIFHSKGARPTACILLYCSSKSSAEQCDIRQELSNGELKWFEKKEAEMRLNMEEEINEPHSGLEKERSLDTMLGFQVLRNNFNFSRIKEIVVGLVSNVKGNERDLLDFLALLQVYVNDRIPLPCCDAMMGMYWEPRLSKDFEQLIVWYRGTITNDQRTASSVPLLAIRHYFVSKALLEEKKISQITSKFLQSQLLRAPSHARTILCRTTKTMMKLRKEGTGTSKQKFSELITSIIEQETPLMATDILQECFDVLSEFDQDPFLLQQAARVFYLKTVDFAAALELAEKAISMVGSPENSYLFDTKGQVFKEQLKYHFPLTNAPTTWTVEDGNRVLELSFEAMSAFEKSLDAASKEVSAATAKHKRRKYNDAGIHGSLHIALDLIDRLRKVGRIDSEALKCLILKPESRVDLPFAEEKLTRIKRLKSDIDRLMEQLAERQFSRSPFEEIQTDNDNSIKPYNDLKSKYERLLGVSFNEEREYGEYRLQDASEERRQSVKARTFKVCKFTGEQINDNRSSSRVLGFSNVFDLFQWFWTYYGKKDFNFAVQRMKDTKKDLQQNNPKTSFDLKILIYINLFLANFEVKETDTTAFYQETFEYCKCYFENPTKDSYAASLIVMMMWPRDDLPIPYDHDLFSRALKHLKEDMTYNVKDTVHFYLGRRKGLQAFVQAKKLSHESKFKIDRDAFWEDELNKIQKKVHRMKGYSNQVDKILANNACNPKEAMLVHSKKSLNRFSQEAGTFVLGFRRSGPIAFDWRESGRRSQRKLF